MTMVIAQEKAFIGVSKTGWLVMLKLFGTLIEVGQITKLYVVMFATYNSKLSEIFL